MCGRDSGGLEVQGTEGLMSTSWDLGSRVQAAGGAAWQQGAGGLGNSWQDLSSVRKDHQSAG